MSLWFSMTAKILGPSSGRKVPLTETFEKAFGKGFGDIFCITVEMGQQGVSPYLMLPEDPDLLVVERHDCDAAWDENGPNYTYGIWRPTSVWHYDWVSVKLTDQDFKHIRYETAKKLFDQAMLEKKNKPETDPLGESIPIDPMDFPNGEILVPEIVPEIKAPDLTDEEMEFPSIEEP